MEKLTQEFPVQYDNKRYDLMKFLSKHPGGKNYLNGFKYGNITQKMEETNHSNKAKYLLREYMQGGRNEEPMGDEDDLEHLIDWNKGLVMQVIHLGDKYIKWMSSPVDRKAKFFDTQFLEVLTITPWYVVPMVWIPIILYFLYSGMKSYAHGVISIHHLPYIVAYIALGICLWTLAEYTLHRFLFHRLPESNGKFAILVHFLLHGFHHKVPFDGGRLVFPPVPAILIATFFYVLQIYIIPSHVLHILFAGEITGYLIYDMIHFYLHFGSPKDNTHLYHMKRYHNRHHFTHSDTGFGISLTFWDNIFNTTIKLDKLKMSIKW